MWVGTARDAVDFAPKDLTRASTFLQQEAMEGKVCGHVQSCLLLRYSHSNCRGRGSDQIVKDLTKASLFLQGAMEDKVCGRTHNCVSFSGRGLLMADYCLHDGGTGVFLLITS